MKSKTNYVCRDCGYETPKWLGRCPGCGAWNSFEEQITVPPARIKKITSRTVKSHSGIEVKIPGDVFLSDETVEFINNPDGSLSLLVKNVIL